MMAETRVGLMDVVSGSPWVGRRAVWMDCEKACSSGLWVMQREMRLAVRMGFGWVVRWVALWEVWRACLKERLRVGR